MFEISVEDAQLCTLVALEAGALAARIVRRSEQLLQKLSEFYRVVGDAADASKHPVLALEAPRSKALRERSRSRSPAGVAIPPPGDYGGATPTTAEPRSFTAVPPPNLD
ncbi:unnamed protein product [Polarella glacialis]|uniref:Uncharacterized protein n=1 Tax=Polarella glacialis TaxID=89957 RepID=A0A813GNA8_POLGL|nr:unnamed protein product [Polarella glacialis]